MPTQGTRAASSTSVVKRARVSTNASVKKRKLASGKGVPVSGNKGKQRAYERTTIPIPDEADDHDGFVSDQDVEFFKDNMTTVSFLDQLDQNEIARSKRETARLHKLFKPPRAPPSTDDLPPVDSEEENSDIHDDLTDDYGSQLRGDENGDRSTGCSSPTPWELNFDTEQPYEREPRPQGVSWEMTNGVTVPRLPIKLSDGTVMRTAGRVMVRPTKETGEGGDEAGRHRKERHAPAHVVEDVSTGARFGRPAVAHIIGTSSHQLRVQIAKEQIAGICQDILADPEGSLGLLRRLHTFSLAHIGASQSPAPIPNDPLIRRLAMISQLAVFKDIIPGYRIRSLSESEKAEKVSQMVARTREWEQGLVGVYQTYLRALESELKGKTQFAELALRSMCTLLTEVTHFNFRTNLISVVVMRLSRKTWDSSSDLCIQTLTGVFREDITGTPSLEIVRLLNRMVKERKFSVHPNALSCLLHLRLKSELGGIRASETKADKEEFNKAKWESRGKADRKRAKGKRVERPHMSKKAVKALKEKKEIEGQMQEAEAEVDREEKANMQTETLKLLFVLYFRILKAPHWTPLLPAALQGLSRYAHMVNIDFFKDLMQVLKDLVTLAPNGEEPQESHIQSHQNFSVDPSIQHQLLCIVTAFELLSGQGEALNIDLRDFVNHLYALILPISLQPDTEFTPGKGAITGSAVSQHSIADLLFRALALIFPVRSSAKGSPVRAAAFAKRILIACLSFPVTTSLRSLDFVRDLLANEPKLHALLLTEDRTVDGMYRPDLDDPQLSNPFGTSLWELVHLAETHWDSRVRDRAHQLTLFNGT